MIGATVSHYKILEKLGGGGMGVVYKAEDIRLKRTVALKFLPPSFSSDPDARERFVHEAQAASALDHPNICTIHEINETPDGQTFIVMGYYEGDSLKMKIAAGPLGIDDAVNIAIQVAAGLTRAHEAGIVHRDIKPANIMVTSRGGVKLVDFGLAKLSGRSMLTKTGTTMGTAAYMSPEQARGEAADQRADIWSLGVVLYEMVCGRRPFEGDFEQALLYSILNEEPKPLRKVRPDIAEALEQIVQKAMAKNAEERYQSADDLLADLKILKSGKETGRSTVASQTVRKRRVRRAVLIAGLAVIAAGGVYVVLPILRENALASNPKLIAVISFENQTGDRSQDYLRNVLQEAIITSLEQSKYVRVTTRQRIADILKQVGKQDVDYVDNELGLEICRREGAQLMALGTIARAGDLYRTTLKLVDVKTLETTTSYSTSGKGVESLLEKQIDDLSKDVSRGIGVSERKIEQTIRPVAEISTASLEAYQLYVRGLQELGRWYAADARQFFEMAVQKDSMFAVAWFYLAIVRDDPKGQAEAYNKARSLAWRASEKEQYAIAWRDSSLRATLLGLPGLTNQQFLKVRAERFPEEKQYLTDWAVNLAYKQRRLDEAITVFHKALELDPTYGYALANLGYTYGEKGEWEKAIETLKRYASTSPGDANTYDSMGDIYVERFMYDEAIANYRQACAVKPDWAVSAKKIMWYGFVREEYESALQWADSNAARNAFPGNQALPLAEASMWERALIAFWQGKLDQAEKFLEKRDALLVKKGRRVERGLDFLDIWIAYERGQFARSRRALDSWVAHYAERTPIESRQMPELFSLLCRGYIEIRAGRMDSAAACLSKMESIVKQRGLTDTTITGPWIQSYYKTYIGVLRSELLMASGRTREALAARPRDDAHALASGPILAWGEGFVSGLQLGVQYWFPHKLFIPIMVDIVPRAYLALGELDSSISVYERAISHHEHDSSAVAYTAKIDRLMGGWPIFPRYHYRLAQVYERKGLSAKAIPEYEKFLKIWGKADGIYKEPADARVRLARLRKSI